MDEPIQTKVPPSTKGEMALTVGKIAASFIPVAGGAVAEVFGALVAPELYKRREAWLESIAKSLELLRQRVASLKPETLAQDPAFVSTFLQASQAAMRTHQEEKLDALRNAVLNSALPGAPDDDLRQIFLSAIEAITPCQIKVLRFLLDLNIELHQYYEDLPGRPLRYGSDARSAAVEALDCLNHRTDLYELYVADLRARGFIEPDESTYLNDIERLQPPRVAGLGEEFLAFVTAPETSNQ